MRTIKDVLNSIAIGEQIDRALAPSSLNLVLPRGDGAIILSAFKAYGLEPDPECTQPYIPVSERRRKRVRVDD